MEKSSSSDDKLRILKKIENIGNRDFDGVDVTKLLKGYLQDEDEEIILSALQAAGNYPSDEGLFRDIFKMAQDHGDEEIRAMANSCLGAVIQDGLEFEEEPPAGLSPGCALVTRDFYQTVREHLVRKVDAPMESMEVRRRALEGLGYLGYLPQFRQIVLRFYHQAPNPYVKVSALYAMGLVRDAVFERLILEELYAPSEPVLLEAMHSAACLGLHACVERLTDLSRSPSQDIRYEAVMALGSLAPLATLPGILSNLEATEKVAEVREAIAAAGNAMNQRRMLDKGEDIWDDGLILGEIEDMVDGERNDPEE